MKAEYAVILLLLQNMASFSLNIREILNNEDSVIYLNRKYYVAIPEKYQTELLLFLSNLNYAFVNQKRNNKNKDKDQKLLLKKYKNDFANIKLVKKSYHNNSLDIIHKPQIKTQSYELSDEEDKVDLYFKVSIIAGKINLS